MQKTLSEQLKYRKYNTKKIFPLQFMESDLPLMRWKINYRF